MTITTRLLDAADAAVSRPFACVRSTPPTSFLPTLDEESQVPVDEFATRITPTHERAVYGAFDGDTLVGITGVRRDARVKIAHKATIWGVFVDPAYRGRGIAQTLLERDRARGAGMGLQAADAVRERGQRHRGTAVCVAGVRAVRDGTALDVRRWAVL